MDAFRLAAKALIVNAQGEVLLLKREFADVHQPGMWEIPGGRLEIGESPFSGLSRQVLEETGLAIDVLAPLAVAHYTRDDGQVNTLLTFFCRPQSFEVRLASEHVGHQWLDVEKARTMLGAYFSDAIDVYVRAYAALYRAFPVHVTHQELPAGCSTNWRIAVKALIVRDDGLLLLIKRSPTDAHKPGVWEIPGGRLELAEDPIEGVQREVREETGLAVRVAHPLRVHHFARQDGQLITMIIFLCRADAQSVQLSHEHTALDWLAPAAARARIVSDFTGEIDAFERVFLRVPW